MGGDAPGGWGRARPRNALVGQQAVKFFTAGSVGSDQDRLDLGPLATRSVVYAADGSQLGIFHDEEYRIPVPLSRVPDHVKKAVLDAEDERFYDHGPLDLRAMARAMVNNLEEGGITEGGSTITQQLVKTVLLTSKQDVSRKLQEAALAIRLEDQMTKDEIFERYLNTVYFGNHSYGIQAAAERYYRTDVDKLTVGQAVLLAGLIRNPVYADPYGNPEAAKERRDVIVDRMVILGDLTPIQADYVKAEPMPPPLPEAGGPAPGTDYFTEYVKQQLLNETRLGDTDSQRYQAVFRGGLSIHTTLNPEFQRMAEDSVASILPDTDGKFTAALVRVEPGNGAVRALVGGSDFTQTKFNLVTDTKGRQTGSSFKPFTLAAALESGLQTNDTILGSAPCVIPDPGSVEGVWKPENVEGGAAGTLSLTDATVSSVNCAYARLVKLVGPDKVVDVAHRHGHHQPPRPLPVDHPRGPGRDPAADGFGLRHPGRRRRVPHPLRRRPGRGPRRQRHLPQPAQGRTGHLPADRPPGQPGAQPGRPAGYRHRGPGVGVGRRRQDGVHRQQHQRLVRWLHPDHGHRRVDGGAGREHLHAQRQRGHRLRRHLPGPDLGLVHPQGPGRHRAGRLHRRPIAPASGDRSSWPWRGSGSWRRRRPPRPRMTSDAKPNPDGGPTATTTPKIVVPTVPTAPTIPEVTIPDIDALIAQARERALNGNRD